MSSWIVPLVLALALVSARADGQPRGATAVDAAVIRVQADGNELDALRAAPVAYSSLEQIVANISRAAAADAVAVRIARAFPAQEIDYLLCVTSGGTLVVGQRLHARDADGPRRVFVHGEILRSYPPLTVPDGWLWVVDVPLSRQLTVTLQVRAPARWPLEAVAVSTDLVP